MYIPKAHITSSIPQNNIYFRIILWTFSYIMNNTFLNFIKERCFNFICNRHLKRSIIRNQLTSINVKVRRIAFM